MLSVIQHTENSRPVQPGLVEGVAEGLEMDDI